MADELKQGTAASRVSSSEPILFVPVTNSTRYIRRGSRSHPTLPPPSETIGSVRHVRDNPRPAQPDKLTWSAGPTIKSVSGGEGPPPRGGLLAHEGIEMVNVVEREILNEPNLLLTEKEDRSAENGAKASGKCKWKYGECADCICLSPILPLVYGVRDPVSAPPIAHWVQAGYQYRDSVGIG
ncbi:hypothetical protein BD309DRAFT_981999 [Dichomitus squalens]|nr:hypothetical protein BD309DRAFT_981999 [Dichomitus squalens]